MGVAWGPSESLGQRHLMDLGLKDKFALVTGGSRGIGRAIALALAEEGCGVVVCARGEPDLILLKAELNNMGVPNFCIPADVTVPADRVRVWKAVEELHGFHILVHNAGGGGRWGEKQAEKTPEGVWAEVYEKNAGAATWFTMRAIPLFLKQWVSPATIGFGRVVTIASVHGLDHRGRPWFSMAKAAEIALMRSLAGDPRLAGAGLTFNSVAPGPVMAGGWLEVGALPERAEAGRLVLGRLGMPEEVASAVVFLCSEKSSLINGACLVMDGGGRCQ